MKLVTFAWVEFEKFIDLSHYLESYIDRDTNREPLL